jgi:hypothetical protein
MLFRRKPVETEIVEGWQLAGPRSLDSVPAWMPTVVRIDRDPDQNDTTRDDRLVLDDGSGHGIMLYVGHWLIRHPDGTLEPMTDKQVQARFEQV